MIDGEVCGSIFEIDLGATKLGMAMRYILTWPWSRGTFD